MDQLRFPHIILVPLFTCLWLATVMLNTADAQYEYQWTGPTDQSLYTEKIASKVDISEADLLLDTTTPEEDNNTWKAFRTKPGLALLGSAIFPGSAQAINGKWWRTGLYVALEAATLGFHLYYQNEAERQEQEYIRYANNNWSVVNYAKWLVDYNNYHNGTNMSYSVVGENLDEGPSYDTSIDWQRVDLAELRELERETIYYYTDGSTGRNFSHVLPDYGSQQYYELISKYYQFGPGWNDFGSDRNGNTIGNLYQLPWDGTDMPSNFFAGASQTRSFNDNYRRAGNLITLLLANHIASAIDGYFTVKLANQEKEDKHTIDPSISFSPRTVFSLKYNF